MPKFTDVRLHGFSHRTPLATVNAWLDAQITPLQLATEAIPLTHGLHRVLAQNYFAPQARPSTDIAALDGYAVQGAATVGASDYTPLPLHLEPVSTTQPISATHTVSVAAGDPLPVGADAVLPVAYATLESGQVLVTTTLAPGANIIRQGLDIALQHPLFQARQRLRVQDIAALTALGETQLNVLRPPSVDIVVLGTELVPPGTTCSSRQVIDSNTGMLQALVKRDGGQLNACMRLPDDSAQLKAVLQEYTQPAAPEVLLIAGGSGVGADDIAPSVVAAVGELAFHGVALRPADSLGVGKIGETVVVVLPGAPVACFCGYDAIAGRLLRQLAGYAIWPYPTCTLPLAKKIVSPIGTVDYYRVQRVNEQLVPLTAQGAFLLTSLTQADGFVWVPETIEGYPAGAIVTAYCYG